MKAKNSSRAAFLPLFLVPLALAVTLSGCTLLGLGAAAGAVVGGCAVLDENEDERITQQELSTGLFNAWDTNNDNALSRGEFQSGVNTRDIYNDWADDFDDWDTNDNNTLSRTEFEAGVAADERTTAWLDRRCDQLGL